MTAPMRVDYHDVLRVWREADIIPEIEHAWLFDHLMPIGGDPNGPTYEGWTLLSALAAQTRRLRLGLLVTSNRFRPPAMPAKIATTVDIVSGGRLDFGIGVGSRPSPPTAHREYAFGNPKPVQRPHPPILIGGRATSTLRVVAEHADMWNIPGGDIDDVVRRSALLDRYCAEVGRDPASITRSIHLSVSYDRPGATRDAIDEAIDAGFGHVVLGLSTPYPVNVARWVADELINTSARGGSS
ncbi:LLM class flavin-dependent oxidoreductase [Streptomyces sp. NPDC097640]|uniref:LLM class flavin-dependent oxidoreductase n=1 Tax=Streptomyces sp. NPDC097640 TaxID=3157229 RepID=UPI00331BAB7E